MPMLGLIEILFLLMAVALPVYALFRMRNRNLDGLELILWVLIVIAIPLLGSLAFLIVRPGNDGKRGE